MNMNKEVMLLDVKDVLPNRFQPRIVFDEKEITELSESIKEHGVIQPIVVRKIADKYEIIAGERRYKASLMAGKTTIPAIVTDLNDKDSAEIALIENIQRSNLSPIEEAISYKKILDMGYLNQSDLALKLGKTQSTVANKLRLLNLSEDVQEELLKGKISERHARSLLRLSKKDQEKMVKKIIKERMTVRKTDEEIEKILHPEENEEKKKIIKYILEEEGEEKMMENQETMGSFNIPTTPILEENNNNLTQNNSNVQGTMNFMNNEVETATQNVEMTQNKNLNSPITYVEPMSPINPNQPSMNSEMTSAPTENQNKNIEKPINPFFNPNVSPINPPTMNQTNTSIIDNAVLGQNSVEATQTTNDETQNISPLPIKENDLEQTPIQPVNPFVQSVNPDVNSISTNNIANVDPTSPEPVTGGKFFNMFSETMQEADEDNGSDQSTLNPFMQKVEETPLIAPEPIISTLPQDQNIETPAEINNNVIPSIENVNYTQNMNDELQQSELSPMQPSVSEQPVMQPINPFEQKIEGTPMVEIGTQGNLVEPLSQENNIVNSNLSSPVVQEPISIDTVPTSPEPIVDQPVISPTEMTPLQTYRLNDEQTFENTSVVELGSFGSGRMEEAVLQPLRIEETKKPKAALKEVINTIRDCAKQIENLGYSIDTDEIDFEDNYQVTFKIMKEDI